MIAWTNEAEAIGYAASRLEDAVAQLEVLNGYKGRQPYDGLGMALEAIADTVAALVMVKHTRLGDALVTIDQLAVDHVQLSAAQPRRTCCVTFPAEPHANGCYVTAQRPMTGRVAQGLL